MELFKYLIIIIQKLGEYFRYIYFLTLPLLYIWYIIYIRLFLERPLRPLFVELSSWQIFFTLIAIFGLMLRIYFLLKNEGIIGLKESKNPMVLAVKRWCTRFNNHLKHVKISCYRILLPKNLPFALLVLTGLKILYSFFPTIKRMTIFIWLVEILPRIIVLVCFLLDIFLFREFNYFYKSLSLLLLPLFFSLLTFLLTRYYADNIEPLLALISSTPCNTPGWEDYDDFCFVDPDEVPDFIQDIDDFIDNHFLPIWNILFFVVHLKTQKEIYYSYKVQLVVLSLHLIGWISILFFGIYV